MALCLCVLPAASALRLATVVSGVGIQVTQKVQVESFDLFTKILFSNRYPKFDFRIK